VFFYNLLLTFKYGAPISFTLFAFVGFLVGTRLATDEYTYLSRKQEQILPWFIAGSFVSIFIGVAWLMTVFG
jgi:hypothetical protein